MQTFRVQLHQHIVYHVEIEAESLEDAMAPATDPNEFIADGSATAMSEWIDIEEQS